MHCPCNSSDDVQVAILKETSCESCWSQHEWKNALSVEQVARFVVPIFNNALMSHEAMSL